MTEVEHMILLNQRAIMTALNIMTDRIDMAGSIRRTDDFLAKERAKLATGALRRNDATGPCSNDEPRPFSTGNLD